MSLANSTRYKTKPQPWHGLTILPLSVKTFYVKQTMTLHPACMAAQYHGVRYGTIAVDQVDYSSEVPRSKMLDIESDVSRSRCFNLKSLKNDITWVDQKVPIFQYWGNFRTFWSTHVFCNSYYNHILWQYASQNLIKRTYYCITWYIVHP